MGVGFNRLRAECIDRPSCRHYQLIIVVVVVIITNHDHQRQPISHLDGNEQVEDSNDDERYQVAGEKDDAEREDATDGGRTPLGVACDVLESGHVVDFLTVDEHPRRKQAGGRRPDEGDDDCGRFRRHPPRLRVKYRQKPDASDVNF